MNDTLRGPDLTKGVALSSVADGAMLLGHAHGEPVLLARHGDALFAIGAVCTHYGAPLADGLLVDETVRCPWHHACFSLRTGEALRPPALDPVSCWHVEPAVACCDFRVAGARRLSSSATRFSLDWGAIDGKPLRPLPLPCAARRACARGGRAASCAGESISV